MSTSNPVADHWFWLFSLGLNFGKYQRAPKSLSGAIMGFGPPASDIGSVPVSPWTLTATMSCQPAVLGTLGSYSLTSTRKFTGISVIAFGVGLITSVWEI